MLIHCLFLTQRFLCFILIFRKRNGILFSKGLRSLNAFFRLQNESLRLKYFQTFLKILYIKIVLKYVETTKHI
jgi:hypothetical protein